MPANERLRTAMIKAGLTAPQLAAAVGVDPKTAERWVSTGRTPHPSTARKTADLLGTDMIHLWPAIVHGRRRRGDDAEVRILGRRRSFDEHPGTRPITISVDTDLYDYVQRELQAGRLHSVSAFFNVAGRAIRLSREAWRSSSEPHPQGQGGRRYGDRRTSTREDATTPTGTEPLAAMQPRPAADQGRTAERALQRSAKRS